MRVRCFFGPFDGTFRDVPTYCLIHGRAVKLTVPPVRAAPPLGPPLVVAEMMEIERTVYIIHRWQTSTCGHFCLVHESRTPDDVLEHLFTEQSR